MCLCTCHVLWMCPQRLVESIKSSGNGVIDSWMLLNMGAWTKLASSGREANPLNCRAISPGPLLFFLRVFPSYLILLPMVLTQWKSTFGSNWNPPHRTLTGILEALYYYIITFQWLFQCPSLLVNGKCVKNRTSEYSTGSPVLNTMPSIC